jgi:hypothetical protein
MNRALVDFSPETESLEQGESGLGAAEWFGETATGLSEADEMELSADLLEVSSEEELEQFLGSLIRRAGPAVGRFVSSPTGRALGGILKGAARQALPIIGRGLGGAAGAARGAQFAQAAGKLFGLELEGLSPEDQEFEAARSFVRFGADAVRNAAQAPATAPSAAVAQAAATRAARRFAPGLARVVPAAAALRPRSALATRRGRWVRRGRNIIIVNC